MENIRNHLLKSGVKNLIEFGYENANVDNIMTDEVYKVLFESMLEENLGLIESVDNVIIDLLKEINNN